MASEQSEYWSKVARSYDRVVELQIGRGCRALVRERLDREGRLGSVAEFGCGTGYYTEVLASHADLVMATDFSPGMLGLARERIEARNVTLQAEDVQRTSFPEEAFDTVFMSLVLQFTEPERALAEVRRILKPGGILIVSNLDPGALGAIDRLRCAIRIVYHGITGYRAKPPKGFGSHIMTARQLCDLLVRVGFKVLANERIQDPSRSSNIPLDYIRAQKVPS